MQDLLLAPQLLCQYQRSLKAYPQSTASADELAKLIIATFQNMSHWALQFSLMLLAAVFTLEPASIVASMYPRIMGSSASRFPEACQSGWKVSPHMTATISRGPNMFAVNQLKNYYITPSFIKRKRLSFLMQWPVGEPNRIMLLFFELCGCDFQRMFQNWSEQDQQKTHRLHIVQTLVLSMTGHKAIDLQTKTSSFFFSKRVDPLQCLMNRQTRGKLLNFFKELIEAELAINHEKAYLISLTDYHPQLLIRKIAGKKEVITIGDLKEYLTDKVAFNPRQMYHIFETFDHRRIGAITKSQFMYEMLPLGSRPWKKIKEGVKISTGMQSGFLKLISVLLRSCRVLDTWRQELKECPPYQIFEQLDSNMTGVLGIRDLQGWFVQNGEQLNNQKAKLLYLTLLRRHYPSLNLQVFCQNLYPMQWGGYRAYRNSLTDQHAKETTQREQKCRQAASQEHRYYQAINNHINVSEVHKEASLTRQKELEDRLQKEVKAYEEMKYLTRKRYHPELTFEEFLLMERQEAQKEQLRKEMEIREALMREQEYRDRIKNVEIMNIVQGFKTHRQLRTKDENSMNQSNRLAPPYPMPPNYKINKQKLEDKVKRHRMNLGLESSAFRHVHR